MQAAIVQGELRDCVIRKFDATQSASAASEQSWAWFMILIMGAAGRPKPTGGIRTMASGRGVLWGVCALVAAGAIMGTNLVGFADTAPPLNAKAKRGSAVFQQNCVSCHNKQPGDSTPFGPPNLHGIFSSKPLVTPPITPAQATDVIKKGKAPMPAFSGILTDAQISDLIAYLKAQ
jgi:mono/diheme cytochrome c family protein